MLSHKDTAKHKVLTAVYKYLDANKKDFQLEQIPWSKMKDLTQKYSFKDYPFVLTNPWSDAKNTYK
jgi:hypothetical protein